MRYEDLDGETRRWMRVEFQDEESRTPYRSKSLSPLGRERFRGLMEAAIAEGSEESLAQSLSSPELWNEFEPAPRGGVRRTDPTRASRELARQEFNTWYVRGLCRRLMEEGEDLIQVYRANGADEDECEAYENRIFEVRFVYNGHRARYWPVVNPRAFSIPCGPLCGHSVRRIPPDMKAMLELESLQFGAAFRKG